MKKSLLTLAILALAASAQAQILYSTAGGNYTQNFNVFTAGATNTLATWTNNNTIVGWYSVVNAGAPLTTPTGAQRASNNVSNTVDNGTTPNSSTQYSQLTANRADASATDYALGSFNAFSTGLNYTGALIQNTTGSTLTSFSLSYTGEQWLAKAASGADPLTFQYSLNASSISDGAATWVTVSSLTFNDLTQVGTPTTTAISGTVSSISWTNSSTLAIRWADADASGGTDGNKAIDDLTFSAIPEPTTWALLAGSLTALVVFRRRRQA